MKNLLICLVAILSLAACDRNENSVTKISGEWKLQNVKYLQTNQTTDYSNENIIYNFQSNNILKVSGATNFGYPDGTYSYQLKSGYLNDYASANEQKIELVLIENEKWTYSILGNELKLDQSYLDGPTLTFMKK